MGGDGAEFAEDVDELDGVEAEVLAAGADGLGDVLGLGGGHHEDDVVGWLLEGLEEGVEGGVGDLVGLVEDVDLVAVAGGSVAGGVPEFADLVDATIGGGVDLDDVDGVSRTNSVQDSQTSHGSAVGRRGLPIGLRQLRAAARMRAMVVLPMPRWPEKM